MRTRLRKVSYVIRRYRRLSQLTTLALLILAPFLKIFRFDIPTASLYLFGMRLWLKHVFLVSLLATLVIYGIVATTLLFGRVFCGWVCPQNFFNEVGRTWDARFGRIGALLVSVVVGVFGGFVVWSYGSDGFQLLARYWDGEVPIAPTIFILGAGAFFAMAMWWWRIGVCQVACPYGHLQAIITSSSTMRLELFNLPENRNICATCGLCEETCHMGVDPRTPEQKHCVACGDCLDACQLVSDARRVPRVLNFVVGARRENLRQILPRVMLPGVLAVVLITVTGYGIANRSLVEVLVAKDHRAVMAVGGTASGGAVMRVSVMNLSDMTDTFHLQVEGLPEGWASLEKHEMTMAPGEKADIMLRVNPTEYRPGLYPFRVEAVGRSTGATSRFETVHVIGK